VRIRCGTCHGEFWIAIKDADGRALRVACPTCQSDYVLHVPDDAAQFETRLAKRAFTLVRLKQLDLPSAYSVLLGVMTVDDTPDLEAVSVAPAPPPPPSPARGTPYVPPPPSREASRGMSFDRAFQHAVESGHLTPVQAMQRGTRSQYIDMLAARYELPRPLAEEVADNHIALQEALRICDAEPGPPVEASWAGVSRKRRWDRWALAVAFTIALVVWVFSPNAEVPAGPPEASGPAQMWSVRGADVLVDGYGRVMKVSAPEAETVLTAYCASHEPRRYVAVGSVPARGDDAFAGERLGLLRRAGGSGELLAIAMSEDRDTKRWNAGDGRTLLEPRPAPIAAAARVSGR